MTHARLYIPGPTDVPQDALEAQAQPLMGHRSAEFATLFYRLADKLKRILHTEQHAFIVTASGSGLQEAAVRNAVRPGRKILNMVAGAFGDRWHKIAIANGYESVRVDLAWGQPVRPEDVLAALDKGGFDAVAIVHNETSTGVISHVAEIARAVRDKHPDALLLVDGVSSVGGAPLYFDDWGLDLVLTSSQKALALPPGLAFAAVSHRLLQRAAEIPHRGWYFDLLLLEKYFRNGRTTPATPAITLLYAADRQFDRILAEGLNARWARHRRCMEMTHAWASERGFTRFAEPGYESPTVTCLKNDRGLDLAEFIARARARGMIIGAGYGPLKGETFRIAHMGERKPADMAALFAVLDELF
ncbi:MAG: alanine--glyoxylate aminotransferase family protein [Chloroflexi bacterium]|nr:alanine--glyoxylate aminotransferase family protein [Chloroflexota bacterium]